MATYLITGGAGFIGSHLTDLLLSHHHKVILFDNLSVGNQVPSDVDLIQADIRDLPAIQDAFNRNIDGCFHLAAIPSVDTSLDTWHQHHEVNLKGTLNVLKAAVEHNNTPVVLASSCAVYGNNQNLPLEERLFVQPISSYGCDKLACELNAYYLAQTLQLPVACLRFFNVYGPRQNPKSPYSGVISKFIEVLSQGQSPVIFGDGSQTRDFVYVKDVVNCLLLIMNQVTSDGAIMNICTNQSITILDLAKKIAAILETPLDIQFKPKRVFDVQHSLGNNQRIRDRGYYDFYSLDEGLIETVLDCTC